MTNYAPGGHNDLESSAAIHVGAKPGPDAEEARWSLTLTIFLRLVSLLWIVEGLEQWRRVLAPAGGNFLDLSAATVAAIVFFAVLDLVAAVGLWLVAPWGGVVWLLTVLAQLYVATIKPGFFLGGGALKLLDGALIAAYLFLSWRANVASGEIGALETAVDWASRKLRSTWGAK